MKSQVLFTKLFLNASLGEKKITFEKKSSCSYFHEKLLESYRKLKEAGGYELMHTKFTSTSKLEILLPKGNAGHNVLDLKEIVASARIYVTPLQKDLSLEQTEEASLVSSLVITNFVSQCITFDRLTLSLDERLRVYFMSSSFTKGLSFGLDFNKVEVTY